MASVDLVDFNEEFLSKSYLWLQDDELLYLVNAHKQSKEEQLIWYNSLKLRDDYYIWGCSFNGMPIGVCGIKNVKSNVGEYFGYIGEKSLWGQGIGTQMLLEVIKRAKIHLNLSTLELKVIKNNSRAISLYKKLGFTVINSADTSLTMIKYI